jgi:glutaredoxin
MAGGPQDLSELEKDPRLFLYTSLTAGSSHIVTATSRIETILRANRIPFAYIDTATDEKAKRLWIRRAGKRKLPALVKDGFVIGVCEYSGIREESNSALTRDCYWFCVGSRASRGMERVRRAERGHWPLSASRSACCASGSASPC